MLVAFLPPILAIQFANLTPSLKIVKAEKIDFLRSIRNINQNLLEQCKPVRYNILKNSVENVPQAFFLLKNEYNSTIGCLKFNKQKAPVCDGLLTYDITTSINLIHYIVSRNIRINPEILLQDSHILYFEYCLASSKCDDIVRKVV